ncbi:MULTISPECIES: hypothetical protein [unclassified Bradyrhizobium]|uniref:hypothetical protein n=1 Tax=unclassified Bradyrhizobium TaxID=2631580 RepID=UPI001FF88F30|nr:MULTISPECIES: hypothetical protein [unclassified Bradyrhizobium]MCK1310822.1 hypothetical protein [Bradyrhizobium sp. 45]MCK1315509.1 hypothetical protein [Bradyrhizobium sp. 23]MCK1510132.1 hypothetical protein [Bradyrhizobium sp. 18]MCK1609125.1 hypothetical protein [Bradyrhizobium sp. 163]MCK1762695.1 hypothetical protein [Bradyrhizobium sp. 136]
MGTDYNPWLQAEAAMRAVVHADGSERLRWIRVAQTWLELARTRTRQPPGISLSVFSDDL